MNTQPHILVFGAGKSTSVLIQYLKKIATEKLWKVTVADFQLELAQHKVGIHEYVTAVQINIEDRQARQILIQSASIVISMLPPALHYFVALDCLEFEKNLLTASYIDDQIRALAPSIQEKGLLFLYEMGLDPGIDHMSAMKIIDQIKESGGQINSFRSHCGGLVAPENDNNPWHYKISWNPRNVVLAGKAGAGFLKDGIPIHLHYQELFNAQETVEIPGIYPLSFYHNRDSLSYIQLYHLEEATTFLRTTLRYPEFIVGWAGIIGLGLTDEIHEYLLNGLSIAAFFRLHFDHTGHSNLLQQCIQQAPTDPIAGHFLQQLACLGIDDDTTFFPFNNGTAARVLQFLLETKLALLPGEKDMIVMLHEFEYHIAGVHHYLTSSLVTLGTNDQLTAMAKTVGLPLGIAAKLILEKQIKLTGLHIPILPEIYQPVLAALENEGIIFQETKD